MNMKLGLLAVAGLAVSALVGAPATAQAQSITTGAILTKDYEEDIDVTVTNDVDVDIAKDVDVSKNISYQGAVVITGNLEVSSAALSLIDNKQIVDDNFVDVDGNDATLTNLATVDGTVLNGADGNIGLNVAVGDNILQENAASLSAIATATAGSSDAEVFSFQKSINNQFDDSSVEDETVTNNVQLLGTVLGDASGNAGVNLSAGAYNGQKNALSLAAVTGVATLSEATAAVLQETTFNNTYHNSTANDVKLGDGVAANFVGNIGMNLSAGTNNLQQNTLAISSVQ